MKFLCFLPLFFLISSSIKFNFEIKGASQRCFKETLPINTHVIGEASFTSETVPNFRILITDEKKYVIFDKKHDSEDFNHQYKLLKEGKKREEFPNLNDQEYEEMIYNENKANMDKIRFAFSTQTTGEIYFCITNIDNIYNTYDFEMSHGIDARDYSNIAKKENLKPAETEVLRLEDFVKEMKATAEAIWVKESHKLEISETFNSNLIWSSLFGIVVIVVFGTFEYYVIKSYFKQKKLI